jgi:hypothetical protein
MKVEATDPTVAVEDLANQIETRHQPRIHRLKVDFFEGDPACRDFGIVPPRILFDRKSELGQGGEDVVPIFARQLCNRRVRLASHVMNDRLSESLGKPLRQRLDQ